MIDDRDFELASGPLTSFAIAVEKKKSSTLIKIYLNGAKFTYEGVTKKPVEIRADFLKGIPLFCSYTFEGDCVTEPKNINVKVAFTPLDGWISIYKE